jgi:hypothetical protein
MPTSAAQKAQKKGLLVLLVIVGVAAVLVAPPALAGGVTVPVSKTVFTERTGSLVAGNVSTTVQAMSAYEYDFSVRAGGMFRTSDTSVSSSNGNTTITIDLKLTNPSGQTTDLGTTKINGGIGTRTHTVYLSMDQGVRVPGSYVLNVYITASVTVGGILAANLSTAVNTSFTIS